MTTAREEVDSLCGDAWGHGCDEAMGQLDSTKDFNESKEALIQRIETAEGGWISVEDSLPERDASVIVFNKSGDVFDYHEYDGKQFWGRNGTSDGYPTYVTHWKPLPSPPTKERLMTTAREDKCKHTTPDKMIRDLKGRLHCVCGYMIDQSEGFNIGYYPLFHKKGGLNDG